MNKSKYIECGKIINTHGVRGDIKIEQRCDDSSVFLALKKVYTEKNGEYKEYKVVKSSVFKEFVLAHFEGVDDFDGANSMRDKLLYALREDIPLKEGSCFIADLIGLCVIDFETGEEYGIIEDYLEGVASGLYLVKTPDGKSVYIPDVPEFIKKTDTEKAMYIKPIGGMFDEV